MEVLRFSVLFVRISFSVLLVIQPHTIIHHHLYYTCNELPLRLLNHARTRNPTPCLSRIRIYPWGAETLRFRENVCLWIPTKAKRITDDEPWMVKKGAGWLAKTHHPGGFVPRYCSTEETKNQRFLCGRMQNIHVHIPTLSLYLCHRPPIEFHIRSLLLYTLPKHSPQHHCMICLPALCIDNTGSCSTTKGV